MDEVGLNRPPAFREILPSQIPIATMDPTKVAQDDSLARMRKSYDQAQDRVQAVSYDKMGDRLQRKREGSIVDIQV